MKGKHEKSSGWRKLLVLSLTVMMAVMFMPASALADGTDGGTQPAASASQSVDKGNTGTGDTGSEAAEQKTEEKEVNQGAEKAIQPSSEQQNYLNVAGDSSETAKESAENSSTGEKTALEKKLDLERSIAFDGDDEACIGETKYKTFGEALSAAKDGATITLLRDVGKVIENVNDQINSRSTNGIVIPSGKNITLNLNAHQVMKDPNSEYAYSIKVESGSTVQIVNQPTGERLQRLDRLSEVDEVWAKQEKAGEAVLVAGIINAGNVTLDNTGTKINLYGSWGSGYSFYNSGSMTLSGNYKSGSPVSPLTLSIVEQNKDAKVSLENGFDADELKFQLPGEVLSELNDGTLEDDYTIADSGSDKVKALMDKNYTTDALYHVQGLTNSKVSLEQSGDKIVLRCLKAAVYLDPKNGANKNDGTASDKAVKTLGQALKLYNESNGSVEIHVLNTVDVTSKIILPEVEKISGSKAKTADIKRIHFVREDSFKGTLFHISSQGKLELSEVTVDGKNVSAEAPLIWVSDGGSLILHDGAVLKNNKNNANGIACGGAVYAEGTNTNVLMNGGEIRSCRAVWGGGIFLRDALLTMNGGTISDNTASDYLDTSTDSTSSTEKDNTGKEDTKKETKDEKDQLGTGGGVCIAYNAVMNMSGGTVSGNTARRGGGVSAGVDQSAVLKDTEDNHRAFTMSGGMISDNTAAKEGSHNLNVTGGGIYVACRNVAEITAGTISGNRVNNAMGYAGGGIYVNGGAAAVEDVNGKPYSNGVLKTQNVYLGGNRDGRNGAAIAVCPTSRLKLYYDGNVVIDPAGDDIPDLYIQYTPDGKHHAPKDENGVPYVGYYLSSIMQDGSPYNWTEKAGRSFETDTNAKLTKEALQLEAHPSADAVNRNKVSCKVFITGNSVDENGGGIAANGDLDFGSKPTPPTPTPTPTPSPTYRHVTVQKTWTLDDGKTRPDSIQVQLMKNGVAYGSPVTLNDANSWTFTWNNLENNGGQWTVNEVLVPQGFTESQKTTEESDGLRVVINNDDQPAKPNKPTNPTKPNKPTNPKTPNKPTNPKTPGKTNKTVNPKTPGKTNTSVTPKTPAIHRAATHNTSVAPVSSVPRTSDATRLGTMLIVFGGAAAALAAVLALKRKDKE